MVAEPDEGGGLRALGDRAIITGLGRGASPSLQPEGIAAALAAIESSARWARGLGATEVHLVATSVTRDAPNREALLGPARKHVDSAEAISGAREAALTFAGAGVGQHAALRTGEKTVVDAGGGSTEIARGVGAELAGAISLDIGAIRLSERFFAHDPPTPREVAALVAFVRVELERCSHLLRPPLLLLAGSATNVAACALGLGVDRLSEVSGRSVDRELFERTVRRIVEVSSAERLTLGGIERGRELPIAAGALILAEVLAATGALEVWIGDGGVRYGLALELLSAAS